MQAPPAAAPTDLVSGQRPAASPPGETSSSAGDVNINPRVDEFEARVPLQLVPRDGIRPIYKPEFRTAAQAPLQDDELVMGAELGGQAKAYPITILRFREIVNDELGGIPTLVTW